MNNATYKMQVYYNILEVFIKKIKISFSKTKTEKKLFNKLNISKIKIDDSELKSKYELFDLDKEPVWEFSLKNWN